MAEESAPDNKNKDDSANNAGRGSAARVSLGQDIVIDPSKPRDDLAPPKVKAYEGYDTRQSKDLLVLLTGHWKDGKCLLLPMKGRSAKK